MRKPKEVAEYCKNEYKANMQLWISNASSEAAYAVAVLAKCLGKTGEDIEFDKHCMAAMMFH